MSSVQSASSLVTQMLGLHDQSTAAGQHAPTVELRAIWIR